MGLCATWRGKGDEGDSSVMPARQMRYDAAKTTEHWVKAGFAFESGLAFSPPSKSHLMGGIVALMKKIERFGSLKSVILRLIGRLCSLASMLMEHI